MERFLKPGFIARPKEEDKPKASRGRPKVKEAEGALSLGGKRPRTCSSHKAVIQEQRIRELERRFEVMEAVNSQAAATADERLNTVLSLHEEAEAENKHLRELLATNEAERFF